MWLGWLAELPQQSLHLTLRQPLSNHPLRDLLLGLPVEFVAFGKGTFLQPDEGRSHPGVSDRSAKLDDDRDLIVVAVAEPEEGHPLTTHVAFLLTSNHNNKNRYNNFSGNKQSKS